MIFDEAVEESWKKSAQEAVDLSHKLYDQEVALKIMGLSEILPEPSNEVKSLKPEGITSGQALLELSNMEFNKSGGIQKRNGYCVYTIRCAHVKTGCDHTWNTYQGFTDSYDYCSKCDKKR